MNPLLTYQQHSVETAAPGHLIVMLYDALLAAIDTATAAMTPERADVELVHDRLTRAQDIVAELLGCLDPAGGSITSSLADLYEFCHHQLVEANLRKVPEPLDPVRSIVADLREAWVQIVSGPVEASA